AGGVGDLVGQGDGFLRDLRPRFRLDPDEVVVDDRGLQTARLGHVDRVDHEDAAGGVDVVLQRVHEGVGSGGDGRHVVDRDRFQIVLGGLLDVHAHQAEGGGARSGGRHRVLEVVGARFASGDLEGPGFEGGFDLAPFGLAHAEQLEVAAVGVEVVDQGLDGGAAVGDDGGVVRGGDRCEVAVGDGLDLHDPFRGVAVLV